MRKRRPPEGQASLFPAVDPGSGSGDVRRVKPPAKRASLTTRQWRMPELQGRTVAQIRVRWPKRLTPAQMARVEVELSALPKALGKLGFGAVQVEHAFVRRRRG
jgi:hypothetical protein